MKTLIALLLTICVFSCANDKTAVVGDASSTLDRQRIAVIVGKLASEFERQYLFPEVGSEVAAHLRKALQKGEYFDSTSPTLLARRLTDELRGVTHDVHVTVFSGGSSNPNPVFRTSSRDEMNRSTGFERVDRLRGNVGYIRLRLFSKITRFQGNADAAMRLLMDTDALVIDLRDTPGGDASSVAYLCSYFLDSSAPVHLNTFVRRDGAPVEFWTSHVAVSYGNKPLYILTSKTTGSAAEEFAYDLKARGRATVVGEQTIGGAHTGRIVGLDKDFSVFISTGRAVNPVTQANWEGTGVAPNIPVPARLALTTALDDYLKIAVAGSQQSPWLETLKQLRASIPSGDEAALFEGK